MKDFFKNLDIDFNCPNCNQTIKISVNDVGKQIFCSFCGQAIELHDNGFSSGLKDTNQALNQFSKDLNNMFK